jgi:hypothetical protein
LNGGSVSQVCVECVKDKNIKQLIIKKSSKNTCTLCGEEHLSIDFEDSDFISLVKAVLRFNFSEWEYNRHWGGDGYECLFYGEDNVFFKQERAMFEETYEELVLAITEGPVYEDYDKGISIFSGYGSNHMQNTLLESIKSSSDRSLVDLANRLKYENYFKVEEELLKILDKFTAVAEVILEQGATFYRARVGVSDKKRTSGTGFSTECHFTPYTEGDIGSPPPLMASAGRINRPGVAFFYCATDKYTAVAEVRPHPGDNVSIGKFRLLNKSKIFNLSESQLLHFYSSDKSLDAYIPLNTLSKYMNKVIPPSERQQYSFTQLIADCIRQMGFDGILFNSTVGNGENIVLFDPSIFSYTNEDAEVVEVEKIKYTLKPLKLISNDERYY